MSRHRGKILHRALVGALWFATGSAALAQSALMPTPKVVIYPGDIIREDMLVDLPPSEVIGGAGAPASSRTALIGKMARRTLLPGRAISPGAVDNPRLVSNGAEVSLVYAEGGLMIVTTGAALQDGGLGDVVKVRNSDSGVTVSGVIQVDGSVRLRGG